MRYSIAKELMENYGWTQVEVSGKLSITQAAVSKYMGGKLDDKVKKFSESSEIKSAAKGIAKRIVGGEIKPSESIYEFCFVCSALRKEGKLCKLHFNMKKMEECRCDVCR
jgi:predicted transcriptional regulator